MRGTKIHGRRMALALVLAALGSAALTAPANAQASSRFRVLLAPVAGDAKTGDKIIDAVRKSIDNMNTHVSVPEKDIKAALKKFGVKEADASCLTYRQLMGRQDAIDVKLVMCSEIDASGQMVTQFFNPDGSSYDVPPFAVTSPAQAAEQITSGFGNYVKMLSVLTYCDDYLRSSQWQEALDNCNQAVELNPKSTHAIYGRGSALMNLERHEEALAAFQSVIELDPINQDALLAGAVAASKLGKEADSRKYLKEYLDLNPGDVQVRLNIATKMAQEGDPVAALALIEEVEAKDTTNLVLREYAGHFAMNAAGKLANAGPANGNMDAAAPYFEKALSHYTFVMNAKGDSTSAVILRNVMVAHGALNHLEQALEWGKRATAHPEADAQTWSAYADQLRAAEKWTEALAALDKVRALDANYAVLARVAFIQMARGQLDEAVASIKKAAASKELSEAQQESLAQNLIKTGFENFQKAKKYETAYAHYAAARDIANTERTKAMANYLQGAGLFEQAIEAQKPSTPASARASKPMFERARVFLEGAGAYADGAANRAKLLQAITQYIEIQDALIKRG